MLIQKVSRTLAEKVFLICQNSYSQTVTTGMSARFLGGLAAEIASTDGVQVTALAAAADMCQFAGIADQDVAVLGYGRFQAWGYVNSVMISNGTTSITLDIITRAGTFLTPGAIAGTLWSGGTGTNLSTLTIGGMIPYTKYVQNMVTTNLSTSPAWTAGFVRAL